MIMITKTTVDPVVNPVDLVKIYVRRGHEKRGKWRSSRKVQEVHHSSGTVTFPGMNCHGIEAIIEDVRADIVDDYSALHQKLWSWSASSILV